MRLQLDQPLRAPASRAQAAFVDKSFYESLGELPGISAPRLRELHIEGERAQVVVGYRFSGQLNGPARRILDPERISWAQVSDIDLVARRTQVRMVPDSYADLLSFSGWYELREVAADECCQHLEADLSVHIPVLGALAEKALARSVKENLASTASLVERWLRRARHEEPA